ncbi:BAHD acyltransferase At5g47980, partial [Linum perenne]
KLGEEPLKITCRLPRHLYQSTSLYIFRLPLSSTFHQLKNQKVSKTLIIKSAMVEESLIRVEPISSSFIKPSTPTPTHLQIFNLSLLDQLSPVAYGSLVLFYNLKPSSSSAAHSSLKSSLSQALTRFYPLAGRIKDESGSSIHCNDKGVVFTEAQASCFLSQFLQEPDPNVLRKLIPVEIESHEAFSGCPLLVQVTSFACNGLAVGVCISQKVADATTLSKFVEVWAGFVSGKFEFGGKFVPLVSDSASSIFPPERFSFTKPPAAAQFKTEKCVTKRFVFDASKIAALKGKAVGERVRHPTRVESVTALIWKCAMNASKSNNEHSILSILAQSASLRNRVSTPLPENTIGNLVGYFASQALESDQIDLSSLVCRLRKGMEEFDEKYVKKLQGEGAFDAIRRSFEEAGSLLQGGNVELYISTSLCKLPFYGVDFGWGMPAWVTVPTGASYRNFIAIWDAKDGDGIEAWVTLSEEDMSFFDKDHELLDSASLNPSALEDFIIPMSSL